MNGLIDTGCDLFQATTVVLALVTNATYMQEASIAGEMLYREHK